MYLEQVKKVCKILNKAFRSGLGFFYGNQGKKHENIIKIIYRYNYHTYECAIIYENFIEFNPTLRNKYVGNDDMYELFIMSIVEKCNFKNYMYYLFYKGYFYTSSTEKYNFPDFKIIFYTKDLFIVLHKEIGGFYKFFNDNGIYKPMYSYSPNEKLYKCIMAMDGEENMVIELIDTTIHLTKKYEPPFLD